MTISKLLLSTALMAVSAPGISRAAELKPETVKAWKDYIRDADLRMQDRLGTRPPFLWTDESADRQFRLLRGEVVVAPVVKHGTQNIPNGLIHDWIGAVFIPKGTIEGLWAVVHDYNNYKEIYQPAVIDSKVLACTATEQEFSMIWQRRVMFVNAAMEGRYRAHDFMVDPRRGYNVADTTRVQEIADYGHTGQHLLPPGTGSGFIWSLHSIAKYEERDGGLYLELEAIALTRDIPPSVRWLANPLVNHLSIDSMTMTLRETRQAVNSLHTKSERPAICKGRDSVAVKSDGKE
jgi:hypothetical protein